MGDAAVVLQKAEQLELLAAQIYHALAAQFGGAEERSLFGRLEKEEIQHAARVKMLASQYLHDRKSFREFDVDMTMLDKALACGRSILARIPTLDFASARSECAGAETMFAAAHAEGLAQSSMRNLGGFFMQLAAADREHIELLKPINPPR
jgi:rubrerythrin